LRVARVKPTIRPLMANYLLIESRDPFESNDVGYYFELSSSLVKAGNEVTLFLVQNGVLTARPSPRSAALSSLAKSGVKVLADDFSLKERGISQLADGITASPIDVVVDHLAAGTKTLWH
jgi:sulfur relay (sulfurtransferase) complex TusBCD TusD component (DsrE family)